MTLLDHCVTGTEFIELGDFVEDRDYHALGSNRWPNNGLSPAENRRLFSSRKPSEV